MNRRSRHTLLIVLALLFGALAYGPVQASALATSSAATRSAPARNEVRSGPTDPAELGAFIDNVMASEMKTYHIPGAAVSVVKDGQLFFEKGYGYADLEKRISVDPSTTMFRVGSTTKL